MKNKVLQLHKRDSYEFKYIQDKYAFSKDSRLISLADGTTQSFNSEVWAELIAKSFINKPTFNYDELIDNFKQCVQVYKDTPFNYSSNPAIASLEKSKQNKGGTATFVGVQFQKNNRLDVISCGDTNLFLVNYGRVITAFPFKNLNSLDSNDHFINSKFLTDGKVDGSYFVSKTISYEPNDIIILATDALSRLILIDETVIPKLLQIESFDDLHSFCLEYWEDRKLQEDDISAIIISTSNLNASIMEILPPQGFSFPIIETSEFIPSFNFNPNPSTLSEADMKQIPNQLNSLSNDLERIRHKVNFNKILLIILLLLTALNSLILFINKSDSSTDITSDKVEQSPISVKPTPKDPIKNSDRTEQKSVSEISARQEELSDFELDSGAKDTLINNKEENSK